MAFILEVALLYAFALAGYRLGRTEAASVLLAVVFVLAVVALWAVWAAPKSPRRLNGKALLGFKIFLFAAAAALLAVCATPVAAAQFAALATVYLVLALRQQIL